MSTADLLPAMSTAVGRIIAVIKSGKDVADTYMQWGNEFGTIGQIRTAAVNQVLGPAIESRATIVDALVINESLILKAVFDRLSAISAGDADIFKRTIQRDNQYLLEDLAKIYHSSTDASNRRLAYSVYTTFSDGKAPPKIKEPAPEPVLPTLADDAPPSSLPAAAPSSADGTQYLYVDTNAPQLPPPTTELLSTPPAPQVIAPQPASAPVITQFDEIDTASPESLENFLASKGVSNKQLTDASARQGDTLNYNIWLQSEAKRLFNAPSTTKSTTPKNPRSDEAASSSVPAPKQASTKQAVQRSKNEINVAEGEVVF